MRKRKSVFSRIVKVISAVFPENYLLHTTRVTIASPNLPAAFDGFRIVQISDLHGYRFGKCNRRLLAAIAAEKADLIVLTGDLVDRQTRDDTSILSMAKGLCGLSPVFFA